MSDFNFRRLTDMGIMQCVLRVIAQTLNDDDFREFYKKLAFLADQDAVSTTWDYQYSKNNFCVRTCLNHFKSGYDDNYVSVQYKKTPMLEISWGYSRSVLLNNNTFERIYMYSAGGFGKQEILEESLGLQTISTYGVFEYVNYKDEETNNNLKSCRKMIVNMIRNTLNSVHFDMEFKKEEPTKMDNKTSLTDSSPKCMTETQADISNISDTVRVFKKNAFKRGCAYHIIAHEDEALKHIYISNIHYPFNGNNIIEHSTDVLIESLNLGLDAIFLRLTENGEKAWFVTMLENKEHDDVAVIEFAIKSSVISSIESAIAAVVNPPISIWELKHK